MDDLVTWLRARLDEEKERAERGQWTAQFLSQGGRKDPGSSKAYAKAIEREGGYSPARVLAEVEAKRRILGDHDPDWPRLECPTCCGYDGNDNYGVERRPREAYPCRVVRRLALPYADQPGYKEEWGA